MSGITFAEVTCFIIACICLIKDDDRAWRSMVLFLLLTCIAELVGLLLKNANLHNQWLYNIFLVFEASFTSYMFGSLISKYVNSKPVILSGLAVLLLLYVYDIIAHGFFVFNNLTATVMSVIFVMYSFYYYFLLIKDEQYIDLKRSASFWWVAGALLFYFGSTIVNLFLPLMQHIKYKGHNITYFIFTALTVILYSCWSYSFICRKWLTKSPS